jgi:hypothetical protein
MNRSLPILECAAEEIAISSNQEAPSDSEKIVEGQFKGWQD